MNGVSDENNALTLADSAVKDYLRDNPGFFTRHPGLLESLQLPDTSRGDVVDFQHYALNGLRDKLQEADKHLGSVVTLARDQHSMQLLVQEAVLALLQTRNLERFFEVLCTDIIRIFRLDVVRLGLESPTPNPYESYYPEDYYSGMVLIPQGTSSVFFDAAQQVWLVGDSTLDASLLLDTLFLECSDLGRSAACMPLHLPHTGRDAVLAFGSRHKDHFIQGTPTEGWQFLAKVIALRLDFHLIEQAGLL